MRFEYPRILWKKRCDYYATFLLLSSSLALPFSTSFLWKVTLVWALSTELCNIFLLMIRIPIRIGSLWIWRIKNQMFPFHFRNSSSLRPWLSVTVFFFVVVLVCLPRVFDLPLKGNSVSCVRNKLSNHAGRIPISVHSIIVHLAVFFFFFHSLIPFGTQAVKSFKCIEANLCVWGRIRCFCSTNLGTSMIFVNNDTKHLPAKKF